MCCTPIDVDPSYTVTINGVGSFSLYAFYRGGTATDYCSNTTATYSGSTCIVTGWYRSGYSIIAISLTSCPSGSLIESWTPTHGSVGVAFPLGNGAEGTGLTGTYTRLV